MRLRFNSWLRTCAGWLALWLALCSGAALAQAPAGPSVPAVSGAEAKAVQQVIRAQLDAFAADDAPKAYSYASPSIRGVFPSADIFMHMVRNGYPVVYRPASVAFLKPEKEGDEILQPVQMTDEEGRVWIALYTMQRQASGAWLTNGCRLARGKGQVT
jgi:hypothetical protein